MTWQNICKLHSKSFTCGHCGNSLASNEGYFEGDGSNFILYTCHSCNKPTFFDSEGNQSPGVTFGREVKLLPEDVKRIYNEARACISVGAYSSSVQSGRKILMHIAVSQGAKTGLKFLEYVEYLDESGILPKGWKVWVDQIRKKGNEENHELKLATKKDSEDLIRFIEMILKTIYEFPGEVKAETEIVDSKSQ